MKPMKKKPLIVKCPDCFAYYSKNFPHECSDLMKMLVKMSKQKHKKKVKKISYKRNTKVSSRGRKNEVNNI